MGDIAENSSFQPMVHILLDSISRQIEMKFALRNEAEKDCQLENLIKKNLNFFKCTTKQYASIKGWGLLE